MSYFKKMEQDFQRNYSLYIPLSIILQSCVGSVAVMYILQNSNATYFPFIPLVLYVSVTMFFNATVLAQLKTTFVFKMLLLLLVMNIVLAIVSV